MKRIIPYIDYDEKGIKTLYVDGKPYMALAGELHNSSSSSLEYMEKKVWPNLRGLHLDTVILPVYWEKIEPVEGTFDFSLVDGIISQARREEVRLVLLWFGLWKNGKSHYVPPWVKRDYNRFFRSRYANGEPSNTISPLCHEAVKADANAFSKLMGYLREIDGQDNTVIAVQVENEIGFLGADRDCSVAAEKAYREEVPKMVQEFYECSGTWEQVFGEEAPEMFMAYHYALAGEIIASDGKAQYRLPMYVNAWLEQFPNRPGIYPSGGPIAKVMPLWKQVAKSIDLFAPDIYLSDFVGVCDKYTQYGNPLFIPEAKRDPVTASNVFYAFGKYNAMCFSPFGIEDFLDENVLDVSPEVINVLNIDQRAFSCYNTGKYIARSYEILQNIKELLLRYRGTKHLQAFIRKNNHERGCILSLANCDLILTYLDTLPSTTDSAGIVIEDSSESFWIVGCNVRFDVLPKKASEEFVTIARLEEGKFDKGVWKPERILNGDELTQTTLGDMPDVKRIEICLYK